MSSSPYLVVELNACQWPQQLQQMFILPKGKDNLDFEEDIDELESEESESDDEQVSVSAKDTVPGLEEESINFALSGFFFFKKCSLREKALVDH